jgi:hypothetical protein
MLDDDSDNENGTDASATNTVLSEQMSRERCDAELGFYKQVTQLELGKNRSQVAGALPSLSAASERLFSAAGLIVTSKRTRLKSEKVESLVFLGMANIVKAWFYVLAMAVYNTVLTCWQCICACTYRKNMAAQQEVLARASRCVMP